MEVATIKMSKFKLKSEDLQSEFHHFHGRVKCKQWCTKHEMARRKGTALAYILVWGLLSRSENLQNVNQNKLLLSLVLVC